MQLCKGKNAVPIKKSSIMSRQNIVSIKLRNWHISAVTDVMHTLTRN
jgi:hypothetical protein